MFVVYLTKYTGEKLPPNYIGSTSEKKANSQKYFGSVRSKKWGKIFREELRENPAFFSVEILSHHKSREDAMQEELRQQILRDVVASPGYFNESFATPDGFFGRDTSGENNPFFGKTHTVEVCNAQSQRMKGKPTWMKGKKHTEEAKEKNAKSHRGRPAWNSGKKNMYSEETITNMKIAQQRRRHNEKTLTPADI